MAGLKRKFFAADFYYLHEKQKGLCASKDCAARNGIRQRVSSTRDIDHKIPIKLWELMNKKGDPNNRSNLRLLCPSCHRVKTAEDRKKISQYKKKLETKITRGGVYDLEKQLRKRDEVIMKQRKKMEKELKRVLRF